MSLKLGRITLPEPTLWASTGSSHVQVTGSYKASSLTDGMTRRDQLLGMADDLDIPIIPVLRDAEPRVNGYYRVLGVTISTDEFALKQGNLYDYRVDLQPVQGFTQPYLEYILSGALLTNVVGAVAADMEPFHCFPAAAVEYLPYVSGLSSSNRQTAAGNMNIFYAAGAAASGVGRLTLAPANFYIGGGVIEQGSPLQPLVGRGLTQPDTVNWRLSNDMVRVTPNQASASFDFSFWNGSSWSATKPFSIVGGVMGALTAFKTFSVLRNSVEEATIRLTNDASGGPGSLVIVDLSLRRGDRLVRGYVTCTSTIQTWGVIRAGGEAATAITYSAVTLGGIRATVNDASGNRYVLFSYQAAATNDLVNGRITQNVAAPSFDFAIGAEIPGGSSAPNDPVSLAKQYLAAQSESQRVVAR